MHIERIIFPILPGIQTTPVFSENRIQYLTIEQGETSLHQNNSLIICDICYTDAVANSAHFRIKGGL